MKYPLFKLVKNNINKKPITLGKEIYRMFLNNEEISYKDISDTISKLNTKKITKFGKVVDLYEVGKCKFFDIESIRNSCRLLFKFPTKDVLNYDGKSSDTICPICNKDEESNEHIFTKCNGTEFLRFKHNINNFSFSNLYKNIKFVNNCWKLRNIKLHENKNNSVLPLQVRSSAVPAVGSRTKKIK